MLRAITFNIGPIDSKLGGVLTMFGSIAILFVVPWLDTSKVRSAVYRPWFKLFFWLFVINAIFLGWLGSRPAEGSYVFMAQLGTLYYFAFFIVIMPVIGLIETPKRLPNSITEAVLEKSGKAEITPWKSLLKLGAEPAREMKDVTMKNILKNFAAFGIAPLVALGIAFASTMGGASAEEGGNAAEPEHFPIHHPKQEKWSFAGPFGTYDKGQLQRGLKVYKEVCSACHSMNLVAFRTLEGLGYSPEQVKAFAAEYEVEDGPNADGEMFTRKAIPTDHFPSPFPNAAAAAAANNGAAPPDFSLIAKARGVERGFPTFIFDIFTQYAEAGPTISMPC